MLEDMTTIVVTGGTGFIGRHLVAALPRYFPRDCLEIRVLAQPSIEQSGLQNCTLVEGNITQPDSLVPAFRNSHLVFHLAGKTGEPNSSAEATEYWHINTVGTRNVVRAAAAVGVQCIVHMSSTGVYGDSLVGACDEQTPPSPVTVYQRSKLAAEQAAVEQTNRSGTKLIILRASNVFGEEHPSRVLLAMMRTIKKRQFFLLRNMPDVYTNYVYVGDVVDAAIRLTKIPDLAENCLIVNTPTLLRSFAGSAASALGPNQSFMEVPALALDTIAQLVERIARFTAFDPPVTRAKVRTLANRRIFSSQRLVSLLQPWPIFGVSEGLARLVHYYREQGWL